MNRCSVNYYFVDRVVEERYRFLFISYIDFDNKIFLLSTFSRDTTYINSSKIDLIYLDIVDAASLLFYMWLV